MADGAAAGEASIRERARDLRRAGLSVAQIADALGRKAHSPVQRWVADIAPPDWTRRPNAKDDLREAARALRRQGHNYREIAGKLTVSTSSVSLWVRDIEVPEALRRRAEHANRMNSERWVVERAAREEARTAVKGAARDGVGPVSDRELLLAGAVLYWAEGAKDKPYDRRERVSLINSDPGVVVLFERWLDLMEVPASRR